MGFTYYDGIYAYAKKANMGLYLGCKTSIFNNPANQIYTPKGAQTMVREVESGKAGTYDKTNGWMQSYGAGDGVRWKAYTAPYDRAKVLKTDAIDEMQSFANGMVPSINLLNDDFLDNQLPSEIDAANIAKYADQIPEANHKTVSDTDCAVDSSNIINTILTLSSKIYKSGWDGMSVLFIESDVYKNFQKAIIANYGLASGVMLSKKKMTVKIDTGLSSLIAGTEDVLTITTEVEVFDKFYIIRMPEDRMYTKIIMYDGHSDGQTDGGYVPDTDDDDFANIKLLAIPEVAAFSNTRYMVDNFLVPQSIPGIGAGVLDLRAINSRMYGNVEINNAGINQKANAFEYDIRAMYGGELFDNRRRNCFMITDTVGDRTVDSIVVTAAGGATGISVNDGTLQLTATVGPDTATDKAVVWTSADTTKATVSTAGLVTAVANAASVKITATAHDGSGTKGEITLAITNQT